MPNRDLVATRPVRSRRRHHDPYRRHRNQLRERRRAEQRARVLAAQAGAALVCGGWRWNRVARLLAVSARTLRRWCRVPINSAPVPMGRPVHRSGQAAREEVIRLLDERGPHLGVPSLRVCFPLMRRAELAELVRRYRRVWRARHRVPLRVLAWSGVGRVWAIDFTGPLSALVGNARYILAVRDLASGRQLLWRPADAATGAEVCVALADLFARYGAPVVVKCDNGSAFTGGEVRALLAAHGVIGLYSPPHWPRYNGAIEAGIGALKDRTACWSARAGHAGLWTDDDLAGARCEANAQPRSWAGGASPDEAWAARDPITVEERGAFGAAVETARAARERELGSCGDARESVRSEASVARCAIELALTERGYLQYRRSSIPPPLRRRKVD